LETINKKIYGRAQHRLTEPLGGEYVWASSEAARRRATSLLLVGSIAGKHGGSVWVDPDTYAVSVDVPEAEKVACAREIEARVGTALG